MTASATCVIDNGLSHCAITDSYEYDAFGNYFTVSGTTPNNYLYRGEQWDSDLGLYYLRARYYNPLSGRFVSRDPENGIPSDPGTLHKYNYAGGDPINLSDPTGRAQAKAQAAGGSAGIEYGALVLQALQATSAVVAASTAISCADQFLGTNHESTVEYGLAKGAGADAEVVRTGPCTVKEKEKKTCHPGPVYRIFGGRSPLWGTYWTYTDPASVSRWFNAAGVGQWNAGTDIAVGNLVNPDGCECGEAESATDVDGTFIPGGRTDQVVCPDPQEHIELLGTGKTAKGWGGEPGDKP